MFSDIYSPLAHLPPSLQVSAMLTLRSTILCQRIVFGKKIEEITLERYFIMKVTAHSSFT